MKKTRICNLLKIELPIIQGGMLWLATSTLAAAVSKSGALGIISPLAGMENHGDAVANLCKEIENAKRLIRNPFGVNIPLDLPRSGELIDVVLKENIHIVITAAGNPCHYTEVLQNAGICVLHVISSVKQAKRAESCGVNAVIVEGIEAAGHDGRDEISLFSLIPQVADAVSIPLVAAGGIADARGFVAAMALGAEGIQLGTRFVAVDECIAHRNFKNGIVEADDRGTVVTCRKLLPTRSLKTEFSRRLLTLEESGAGSEELRQFLGHGRARKGQIEGDLVEGELYCGSSAGLIKQITPTAMVIKELTQGYHDIVKKLALEDFGQ